MSDLDNILIGFEISTTDSAAELGIRVYLNGTTVHENSHVKESYNFSHTISNDEGEHELAIEMFGKLPGHTTIDEAGNILKDAMLTVKNVDFDGIDVSDVVRVISEYHHDFNGTQAPTVQKFYSNLGCNGTVKLKFGTPVYLWLLENM
jgi:hypothetical protein